jgi:hypothetical protein
MIFIAFNLGLLDFQKLDQIFLEFFIDENNRKYIRKQKTGTKM